MKICTRCRKQTEIIVIADMCQECIALLKIPHVDPITGEHLTFNKPDTVAGLANHSWRGSSMTAPIGYNTK